ncbi:hypothetical protein B0H14DRAFT_2583179 [Mycena olivaceomarginata]|nr:hypothetical protein B0H14DRAFT_2583179 [Mycena olivaceomarginata]
MVPHAVLVERRLAAAREARQQFSSPQRDTFLKTAAYIGAVRRLGCRRPRSATYGSHRARAATTMSSNRTNTSTSAAASQRRRRAKGVYYTTSTRIPTTKTPPTAASHYSRRTPDHWADFAIQDAGYDLDYIAAYFLGNTDELARIEQAAAQQNIGPLAFCDTVRNYSAQTLHCPVDHRVDDRLTHAELCHIECDVKYHIWFPTDFQQCPEPTDTPIPLPEKTPQRLRQEILGLLRSLRQDLPDMTARRFLRHPALKIFLMNKLPLPHLATPTLTALHPSLANRAHLAAYIALVREEHFPHGILHLKAQQDAQLPEHQRYIRVILELDDHTLTPHEEDEEAPPSIDKKTRIISDIGFKRIVGFDEFEIAAMDRDANTTVVFCRVYVTRHTAAVHQRIFHEINQIVLHDTGRPQLWRHLHGTSTEDFSVGLILHWGADQHRGQAKGLGLHLMDRAAELPADAMDLHEPHRPLRLLTPYDHLRRLYRVVASTTIATSSSAASPSTFDNSCVRLHASGTTTGRELSTKSFVTAARPPREASKFAFRRDLLERSYIPLPVWAAGDPHTNLIETVHRDTNREGVHCTLVGGVLLRQDYDELQWATLIASDNRADTPGTGIRAAWYLIVVPRRQLRLKCHKKCERRGNRQAARVQSTALAVSTHNSNMQNFDAKLRGALGRIDQLNAVANAPHLQSTTHQTELKRQLTSPPVPPCPLLASGKPRCVGRGSVFPRQVIAAQTLPGVRRATFLGLPSWSSPPHVARGPVITVVKQTSLQPPLLPPSTLRLYIWPFDIASTFRIPCPAVWTPLYVVGEDHGLGLGQSQWRSSVSKPASSAQQLAKSWSSPPPRCSVFRGPVITVVKQTSLQPPLLPPSTLRLYIWPFDITFTFRIPCPAWRTSVSKPASSAQQLANGPASSAQPSTPSTFGRLLIQARSLAFGARGFPWSSVLRRAPPRMSLINKSECIGTRPPTLPPISSCLSAPVHALPTAPAAHCAPGRCDICDAQYLAVHYQSNSQNGLQTGPLPHRRTCRPNFYPDHPALDVETHSLEAGKHFYVAIPARDEGIYTSSAVARQKTEGVVNGLNVAAKTYTDAKGLWVLGCLRWHGHECRRGRLQHLDARNKHWGLKGSDVICGSRSPVFCLAEDADFDDIHIRGDHDAAVVQEWLDEN